MRPKPAIAFLLAGFTVWSGNAFAQSRHAVILNLEAPLTPQQRRALTDAGLAIGAYLGAGDYFASVAEGTIAETQERLSAIQRGARIDEVSPESKLDPLLQDTGTVPHDRVDQDGKLTVLVTPAIGSDDASVAEALAEFGPQPMKSDRADGWVVRVTPDQLSTLARQPVVEQIESAPAFPALR